MSITPLSVRATPVYKTIRVHFYSDGSGALLEDGNNAVHIVGDDLMSIARGGSAEEFDFLTHHSDGWCVETIGGDCDRWFSDAVIRQTRMVTVEAPYRRDTSGRYRWDSREALGLALVSRRSHPSRTGWYTVG